MTTCTASVARQTFHELVNRAAFAGERIAISKRGKVMAAIIPAQDLEALKALEDHVLAKEAKTVGAGEKMGEKGRFRNGGVRWV